VEKFEEAFAEYTGARYAVALNSCTAGLYLALLASEVGPGDEVITTPLTFVATANVIEHAGARVVFADIDPVTLNLDPASVEGRITPKTKAILAVHFGGLPCALEELAAIAERHGLALLEDAAHAAGARYKGVAIGGHGRLTAFSFYANKNLTTGEGGMLTTSSGAIAERLRSLRLHGLSADAWSRFHDRSFRHTSVVEPGYKFNMPDLAAAVGLPQLRKLEGHLRRREQIAVQLDAGLAGLPFTTQPRPSGETRHSLHLYPLLLDLERWTVPRDRVVDALRAENIGATVHYRPLHQEPFYQKKYGVPDDRVPVAASVGERILSLPISPAMSDGDVADVVKAVRKVAAALTR
jgi:dTDP-4-amino-4,6-dideoxygalactose transaminase